MSQSKPINKAMEEENTNHISFVVFGITGSGKSTLGNTIVGDNAFQESMELESETDETIGKAGQFDGKPVVVIDTPGLQDNRGKDGTHLIQMTQYIKQMTSVKAFVFVINFNNYRFDEGVIRLFQLMAQMYPEKKWYHHIAIVWTNYSNELPENVRDTIEIKRNESLEMIKEKIVPEITEKEMKAIPQLFIDSIDARDPQTDSHKQIGKLLEWIEKLRPLNETLGEIHKVDKDVKFEEIEETTQTVSDTTKGNVRTIITATFERTKKTLYNGDVLFDDWIERDGTRKMIKKDLVPPPPEMKTEEREKSEIIGQPRRQVDLVKKFGPRRYIVAGPRKFRLEEGRILQKKRTVRERRYIQLCHNGKMKHFPWEIIADIEEEIEIGKFSEVS